MTNRLHEEIETAQFNEVANRHAEGEIPTAAEVAEAVECSVEDAANAIALFVSYHEIQDRAWVDAVIAARRDAALEAFRAAPSAPTLTHAVEHT